MSSSGNGRSNNDRADQLRREEQERKDRELAERLQREQSDDTPPAVARRGRNRAAARERASPYSRSRIRSTAGTSDAGPSSSSSVRGRGTRGTTSARRGRGSARGGEATMNRTRANQQISESPNRRRSTRQTRNPNPQMQFEGDRVQVRQGDEIRDITAETYFPDDDDDSDYTQSDNEEEEERNATITISSSESDADSEAESDHEERDMPRAFNPRGSYARSGRGPGGRGRVITPGRYRGSGQHNISADYIRDLLHSRIYPDNPRRDPLYRSGLNNEDESDPENVDADSDDDEAQSNGSSVIDLSDDDDVLIIGGRGAVHADRNHIRQPIFDEDRVMYNHELELYHDEEEYIVPAAKPVSAGGKLVEPDSTWGDCTMCSNPPIKPQGCKKCLQFLGCTDCVRRWYAARKGSMEGSSCPLCRAPWTGRAGVLMMTTIQKNVKKAGITSANTSSDSSLPSTSSLPNN